MPSPNCGKPGSKRRGAAKSAEVARSRVWPIYARLRLLAERLITYDRHHGPAKHQYNIQENR